MILRISSVFVPYTDCDEHLRHVHAKVLPVLESSDGFMCVWLVRRNMVGYSEFALLSLWRSEDAARSYEAGLGEDIEGTGAVVRRALPEIYNVLTLEFRKPTTDRDRRPADRNNGRE